MHLPFRLRSSAHPFANGARRSIRDGGHGHWIQRRDTALDGTTSTIAVAAICTAIVLIFIITLLIRRIRARHPDPKYIPTPFLKRLWAGWKVPNYSGNHQPLSDDDQTDGTSTRRSTRMREMEVEAGDSGGRRASRPGGRAGNRNSTSAAAGAAGVDRNTSIRSIMTLPAYRSSASETEQVLGVEGERGGIDVVVELPTAEDEEAGREEEMEQLYQIRLARRRQIAEREDRRRERREARERHDFLALDELRERTRTASDSNTEEINQLRGDLERIKENRQRAVSSVSYADLGVARADGTRIRANSQESERVGLLSDAASIAPSTITSPSLLHHRNVSTSSVLSVDTTQSDRASSLGQGLGGSSTYSVVGAQPRSRTNSRPQTPGRAGSSPEIIEHAEADVGDADLPPHSPPGYDEVSLDDLTPRHSRTPSPYPDPPPNYPGGPTRAREERLSAHMADLVAEAAATSTASEDDRQPQQPGRGVGGVPQLPSLRLNRLPQIVIEPSSAQPAEEC